MTKLMTKYWGKLLGSIFRTLKNFFCRSLRRINNSLCPIIKYFSHAEQLTAISTLLLAIVTLLLVFWTHSDAVEQVHVLMAAQRPWIKVDVVPEELIFATDSGKATFTYAYRVKNVGSSVAVGILIDAKVIAPAFDGSLFDAIVVAQEKFCSERLINNKAIIKEDRNHTGINLFPNESYPLDSNDAFTGNFGGSSQLSKSEMLSAAPRSASSEERDLLASMFVPYLIGCVTYQSGLSPERHQTGFIYQINKMDPDKKLNTPSFIKINMDLTPPYIIFEKWFFSAGKID